MASKGTSDAKKVNKSVQFGRLDFIKPEAKGSYPCCACGKVYAKRSGNFSKSRSTLFAGNDFYVTICKECTEKYYDNLCNFFCGEDNKAMNRICQLFDWYYSDEVFAQAKNGNNDSCRALLYPSKLNLSQHHKGDRTYTDTIKEQSAKYLNDETDIAEAKVELRGMRISQKTISFFGLGFETQDYKYLDEQYKDWVSRHECKTKAQEEVFKNLCIAQLNISKTDKTNTKAFKEATETFQSLLATANLKPNQTSANVMGGDAQTFGTLIKKFEDEKPIPEPEEEWKDVDGIVRYITVYFLGHLCKMIGIKNSYARMYDEEMSKYKVTKPEYEGDDEALFDSVFGGVSDGI